MIIAPLHKALQKLVNVCYKIGVTLDIKFNETKTMYMVIRAKEFTNFDFLPIMLNGKLLKFCKSIKYLGHVITDTLEENYDVMRQTASIYARRNMIINTFLSYVLKGLNVIDIEHISRTFILSSYGVTTLKQFITNLTWGIILHLECSLILIDYVVLVIK